MVDLNGYVLEEANQRGRYILADEFLTLIERHHQHDTPGVPRDVIEQYATELSEREQVIDDQELIDTLDSLLVDSETWVEDDAIYRVTSGSESDPERISVYPARWHEELGDSTDIPAYLRFLHDDVAGFAGVEEGASVGVSEDRLLDIITIVGRTDRENVKAALQDLREEDRLIEDADQHPEANVYLRERTEEKQ